MCSRESAGFDLTEQSFVPLRLLVCIERRKGRAGLADAQRSPNILPRPLLFHMSDEVLFEIVG